MESKQNSHLQKVALERLRGIMTVWTKTAVATRVMSWKGNAAVAKQERWHHLNLMGRACTAQI